MEKKYINIYQSGRNAAGITQEKAAELLGISVDSLRDYEGGRRFPQNAVVARMIEIYGTPFLAVQHINLSARELSAYLPEFRMSGLAEAVLRLQKEINDFIKLRDELLDITCDNVIDEKERGRFDIIIKELDDISAAVLSLKFVKTR